MRQLSPTIAIGFLVALALVSSARPIRASTPNYQIIPLLNTINLGGDEPLQIVIQHGSPTKSYTFLVNVTTPIGYQSDAIASIITNPAGEGNLTVNYPTDFFAYPRAPNTNRTGTYSVILYGTQSGGGSVLALSSFQTNSSLIINEPEAIDSNGSPVTQISAGGLVYFDFSVRYLNGTQVTSAQASISLHSSPPEGALIPASYSQTKGLYITTQGYQLQENSTQVTISVTALAVDQAGNQGTSPASTLSLTLTPFASRDLFTARLASIALLIGGSGISIYTLRQTKRRLPLKDIRKAVLQSGKRSVLITGRKRDQMTTLLQGFLKEDLESRIPCTYLTFENPVERLIPQLIKAKIDVLYELESGTLRVLDCSDLNANLDLTTLRVRLASALSRIKSGRFGLYVDSLTLPFEDLPTDQVLAFLAELNVEVIRERGVVYATARLTRTIRRNLPSIRDVFDGLFEITPTGAGTERVKLELKGVNEEMEKTPIGELKVASDSSLQVEVPLTQNLEKKITDS